MIKKAHFDIFQIREEVLTIQLLYWYNLLLIPAKKLHIGRVQKLHMVTYTNYTILP